MEDFINGLRAFFGLGQEEKTEPEQIKERQDTINAQSGDNIRFYDGADVSKNYGNVLSDAVKFYQEEFNMTPHANIIYSPDSLPSENTLGTATILPDDTGQYTINFRHLTEGDEEEGKKAAQIGIDTGTHPKNSNNIASIPIHELGHALFGTLFPDNDTSSTRRVVNDIDEEDGKAKNRLFLADDLYWDALKDIGVDGSNIKAGEEKTDEISLYAGVNPNEAIAESLVDYYYNRNDASDLSKAIVNRLKSKSHTYAMDQAGGFNLSNSADDFLKNLRRYKVVQ